MIDPVEGSSSAATAAIPPPTGLRRWGRSRVARAFGSNVYMQVVQAAVQLLMVPLFAAYWGLELYGVWLMLYTIPGYLSMADAGMATAAGNDMTASVARDDRAAAAASFRAARAFSLGSGVAAFVLIVVGTYLVPLDALQPATQGHAQRVVLVLTGYGLMTLHTSIAFAGFKATGGYAVAGYLAGSYTLIEAVIVILLVIGGFGLEAAAWCYLISRTIFLIVLERVLVRRAPWLTGGGWGTSKAEVGRLARPALAVLAMPLSTAFALQGAVLVIGAAAGAQAVPAFTVLRTLSRLALQAVSTVTHALMPSYTIAAATGDVAHQHRLAAVNLVTSIALALPAAATIAVVGPLIVRIWTGGTVSPGGVLAVTMGLALLLHTLWAPMANILLAMNRQESFAYVFLLASAIALAAGYPATQALGAQGMALALLALDGVMLTWIWRCMRRHDAMNLADVVALVRGLAARLRLRPR